MTLFRPWVRIENQKVTIDWNDSNDDSDDSGQVAAALLDQILDLRFGSTLSDAERLRRLADYMDGKWHPYSAAVNELLAIRESTK